MAKVHLGAQRELLLRHIGEQRLTRMTFFLRAPPVQEVWFFGGVERTDGAFVVMDIVGVGYRAALQGTKLVVSAGYSHQVEMVGKVV